MFESRSSSVKMNPSRSEAFASRCLKVWRKACGRRPAYGGDGETKRVFTWTTGRNTDICGFLEVIWWNVGSLFEKCWIVQKWRLNLAKWTYTKPDSDENWDRLREFFQKRSSRMIVGMHFRRLKKPCIEEKPFLFAHGKVCWISEMKEMNHCVSDPPWTSRWQSWTDGAHLLGAQQTGQSRCGCGSSRESCWWCRGMTPTCQGVAKLDLAIPLVTFTWGWWNRDPFKKFRRSLSLCGGFKCLLFSPLPGEDSQFD